MNDQTNAKPAVHLTLKWHAYADSPEIMVNLYGDSADDIAPHLAEVAALVNIMRPPSAPAPVVQEERAPRPVSSFEPEPEPRQRQRHEATCPDAECSAYAEPMIESNHGGLFCPGRNEAEANGYCRWVADDKGLRRKPTRAEIDADRAAKRGAKPERNGIGAWR